MLVLSKKLIGTDLTLPAYATFPALQHFAKETGKEWFELDASKVSEKVGLSPKKIKEVVEELLGKRKNLIKVKQQNPPVYMFTYDVFKEYPEEGFFAFNEELLNSTMWSNLLLSARTFYLALLANAKVGENINEYIDGNIDVEKLVCDNGNSWKVCDVHFEKLAGMVGISCGVCGKAIAQLQNYNLVVKIKTNLFLVR